MDIVSGKALAIVIVVIFILTFFMWILGTLAVTKAGGMIPGLVVFIPGAIGFGFIYLVVSKLWNCPERIQ